MTKSELNEIVDKSNFYPDSNNLYDMQILDALNAQTHACTNCAEADFSGNGARIYCSNLGCYMKFENCCRDWKEEE